MRQVTLEFVKPLTARDHCGSVLEQFEVGQRVKANTDKGYYVWRRSSGHEVLLWPDQVKVILVEARR